MGVPEPSKDLEWASANPTDPISGQPAIIEPSESKKDSGHTRIERPPRQDHNWLFNQAWQWQKHFKSKIAGLYGNLNRLITESGQTPNVEDDNDQLTQALYNFLDPGHIAGLHLMDTGFQFSPREHSLLYSDGICIGQILGDLIHTKVKNSTPFPAVGLKKVFHIGDNSFGYGDGGIGIADGVTFSINTNYHVFVFYNVISNLVDIALDTDLGGANVLGMSGVVEIRRLGSVYMRTDIVGFLPMRQFGDFFFIKNYLEHGQIINASVSNGAVVDSAQPYLPPGISCIGLYTGHANPVGLTGTANILIDSLENVNNVLGAASTIYAIAQLRDFYSTIPFDGISNHTIRCKAESTGFTGTVDIVGFLKGYIDQRGRDWVSGPGTVEWSRFFNF